MDRTGRCLVKKDNRLMVLIVFISMLVVYQVRQLTWGVDWDRGLGYYDRNRNVAEKQKGRTGSSIFQGIKTTGMIEMQVR